MGDALLSTNDASKILQLTPESVRLLERSGKLPATRSAGGIRLFKREDVERLATARG
jgi:excisionase family DNA binding protein